MTLLREIQESAIDSNTQLSNLLRKCKVLAARLGSEEFKKWVDSELSGYTNAKDLPEYRIFRVNSKGHFAGPYGSGERNADIPMLCLPEKFQEVMSTSRMTQPVSSIEALVSSPDAGNAQEPWDPDFVAIVGKNIYQGRVCVQAWKVIPKNTLVSILDEVRNRVLSFVLDIEAQNPDAGEADLDSRPVSEEKINQIFNMTITGDVQNVATGSHHFEQNASWSVADNKVFEEILDAIKSIDQTSITESLSRNIEDMRQSKSHADFKSYYQKFMSFVADHMQVLSPVIGPYLPALTALALGK